MNPPGNKLPGYCLSPRWDFYIRSDMAFIVP
jgi:hypothetical protein